jgi:site-specific DNA-methyltransferase (adenine-specific)
MAHKVIRANCLEYMAKAQPETFDFIFADPPYLLSNGGFSVSSGKQVSVNKGNWDKSSGQANDSNFHLQWISQCQRLLKPNGTIAISGTRHSIYKCAIALEQLGFKILNEIVWFKPNGAPNLGGRNFAESHEIVIWAAKNAKSKHVFNYLEMKTYDAPSDYIKKPGKQMRDVWVIPNTPPREKTFGKHPTQKPLELLLRLISATTTPGAKVLDPFCGSGTTGVAAKMLGRSFMGIDASPSYVDLAEARIKAAKKVVAHD